jgi:hypothetical protein
MLTEWEAEQTQQGSQKKIIFDEKKTNFYFLETNSSARLSLTKHSHYFLKMLKDIWKPGCTYL